MVPSSIRSNLAGLRRRERLLSLTWGVACWLTIVIGVLFVCCFIDWLVDRNQDTPFSVRFALFLFHASCSLAAAAWFIVLPQMRRMSDDALALMVEDKMRKLDHRLISAVQLNKPDAKLGGMSRELVGVVTREAETQASRMSFASVADHDRLKRSAFVLGPALFVALIPTLLWPSLIFTLLARQALVPIDVPHSVTLENQSKSHWALGDDVEIRFLVNGNFTVDMIGTLTIGVHRYELRHVENFQEGAIFGAKISAGDINADTIQFSARLRDGRTKQPSTMTLVARPSLAPGHPKAWLIYPEFCTPPNQSRFEKQQSRGDVVGILGSSVRVEAMAIRSVKSAWIELLGPDQIDLKRVDTEVQFTEVVKAKRPMTVKSAEDGSHLSETFELMEGLSGYRLILEDQHGFTNNPAPRRSLRVVPEDPPQVNLLRVTFGSDADFDVEGLPVVIGGRIRIPYSASASYGLGSAEVLYRVLPKHDSDKEPVAEEPWIVLKMTNYPGDENDGFFDPKTGVFQNTKFDQQIGFHAVPQQSLGDLGRTMGGGRFFLETKGLLDRKTGQALKLKSGDQIEYCVKAYAMPRKGVVPFGLSETRVSIMMDANEFLAWIQQVGREDERVRQLEFDQRRVFERKQ